LLCYVGVYGFHRYRDKSCRCLCCVFFSCAASVRLYLNSHMSLTIFERWRLHRQSSSSRQLIHFLLRSPTPTLVRPLGFPRRRQVGLLLNPRVRGLPLLNPRIGRQQRHWRLVRAWSTFVDAVAIHRPRVTYVSLPRPTFPSKLPAEIHLTHSSSIWCVDTDRWR
jgi:hypothetical protein